MELNQQQLADIKKWVSKMVKYRESYQELYDHVVTALADVEDNPDLAEAVANIVKQDFGSYEVLEQTEQIRAGLVDGQIRKKQVNHLTSYLKLPRIAVTTLIVLAISYAIGRIIPIQIFRIAIVIMAILPITYILVVDIIVNQWIKRIKPSVKIGVIYSLASISTSLMQMLMWLPRLFLDKADEADFYQHHSVIVSAFIVGVFTFFMVYVVSFFKLYRDEFKMQLA